MATKHEIAVADELRRLKHAVPFRSFHIKTTDGQTLTIVRADRMIVSPRGDMAAMYPKEEQGHRVLDLRDVAAVKVVRKKPKKPGKR
jgi:hypothetical protein